MGSDVPKGKVLLQSLHPNPSTSPADASLGQIHASDGQTLENEGPPSNLTMASTHSMKEARLVKIIAEASPETLQAEVKSGLKFLEKLKPHLASLVSHSQYSQHWIQQIGRSIMVVLISMLTSCRSPTEAGC
jgi:hypothetical protein